MTDDFEQHLTIERFENGNIAAEEFDHEAHLFVGWLYVTEFELSDAIARFEKALKRLTADLGVPDKYHATITWLYLMLIAETSEKNESWQRFRARNTDLFGDSKATLRRYYSDARLFSDRARKQFVLPDKLRL